ncbi:hypothetical protein ACLOJK_029465 [Asimina triloba]
METKLQLPTLLVFMAITWLLLHEALTLTITTGMVGGIDGGHMGWDRDGFWIASAAGFGLFMGAGVVGRRSGGRACP